MGVRYLGDGISTGLGEFPRFAPETIVEGGDCEDKSILLAAILRIMGFRGVYMLFLKEHVVVWIPWACYQHVVDDLCYLEASGGYFRVGEVPRGVKLPPKAYYPVEQAPVPVPLRVELGIERTFGSKEALISIHGCEFGLRKLPRGHGGGLRREGGNYDEGHAQHRSVVETEFRWRLDKGGPVSIRFENPQSPKGEKSVDTGVNPQEGPMNRLVMPT